MVNKMTDYLKRAKDKGAELIHNGFLHILFGNTLTKMIAFFSSIVIVRLVSKQAYAELAYADNLYSYITLFSGFGMSTAILKYCSQSLSRETDRSYFSFALRYGSLFQLILSVVLLIYISGADIPFPNARMLIWLLCLYPTLTYVMSTIQSYTRAHLENRLYARMAIIQTVSVFFASILFVLAVGIYGIVLARYISIIIAIIYIYGFIHHQLHGVSKVKLSKDQTLPFLSMSFSLMIANLFSSIMPINEMYLVNNLIRDEIATANYKVAMLIPSQLLFITSSIMVYFFPIVAKMTHNKQILHTVKNIFLINFILIVFISGIGAICTPWIIRIVYGEQYADANTMSYIFWVIYAINAGIRMVPMNLLPAIGKTSFNATVSILSCAVQFVLDYTFIARAGIKGAAVATGIVYFLSAIAYWIYFIMVCKRKDLS